MPTTYNIKFASTGTTGGKAAIIIPPGGVDNSTTLTLPGFSRVDYGEFYDANILQIMEHFANSIPPSTPTIGQIWYNTNDNIVRVYAGLGFNNVDPDIAHIGWTTLLSILGNTTPPAIAICGQLYYNTSTNLLYTYNCGTTSWQAITTTSGAADIRYVLKAGDTMSGYLTLINSNATASYHPVPKIQFDAGIATHTTRLNTIDGQITTLNTQVATLNTQVSGLSSIPSGCIIMWSGSIVSIPSGWLLCDGTLGTPNLRDKFVVGAGTTYAPSNTGGAVTGNVIVNLPALTGSHTLLLTELPSHTHTYNTFATLPKFNTGTTNSGWVGTSSVNTGAAGGGLGHTHTIGGTANGTVPILPPYYALAYIMKT